MQLAQNLLDSILVLDRFVEPELELWHAPQPEPALDDQHRRYTVLVVVRDTHVRHYVLECLRDRTDLRVLEAPEIAVAVRMAAVQPPRLLIVDSQDAAIVDALVDVRVVLIVDELPRDATPNSRVTTLARPFGAQDLEAIVDGLLS